MDGVYLIFCLAMIVLVAVVALVFVTLKPESKKEPPFIYSSQVHLERSRELMERHKTAEAKKHALAAFRNGNHEIRLQAVKVLGALHEVEEF